tara:strand:+ start:378 stop:491 length:114 start_codon:yes stop_codon:yes gene_type:complete
MDYFGFARVLPGTFYGKEKKISKRFHGSKVALIIEWQ